MTDWLISIVVCALATFRIAELFTVDYGPSDIFFRLRIRMGVYDLAENNEDPKTSIGKLFACPYCLGIYIAFALAVIIDPTIRFLLTWPAVAGLQAAIQTIGGRR